MKHKAKKQKVTKTKGFKIAMSTMAGVLAVGAACGITIALTSSIKTEYLNLDPYTSTTKVFDYGSASRQHTEWNVPDPSAPAEEHKTLPEPVQATNLMKTFRNQGVDNYEARFNFSEVLSTSPNVSILDKSFIQSSYYAQTYWINDKNTIESKATNWDWEHPKFDETKFPQSNLVLSTGKPNKNIFASKAVNPAGAGSSDIINTYKAAYDNGIKNLVLPGFEHNSALNNFQNDDLFEKMVYILIDSEIASANIASVQIKA